MKIIIIGLLFLTCCTFDNTDPQKQCFEYFYYENGRIKTVHVYKDTESEKLKRDYYSLDYDSIGNLFRISTVVDSMYNNYSIEFHIPSGNKFITNYENNQKHGLSLVIDKYGRIYKKIIGKRDKLYADFTSFITENGYVTEINFNIDSANIGLKPDFKYAGQYFQDKNFKIIRKNSYFYFIKKLNDPKIEKEHSFRVYCNFSNLPVSEITLDYEIDQKSNRVISEYNNFVNCSVLPYKKGVNVLIGRISIGADTIVDGNAFIDIVHLPFVYQFVCK